MRVQQIFKEFKKIEHLMVLFSPVNIELPIKLKIVLT